MNQAELKQHLGRIRRRLWQVAAAAMAGWGGLVFVGACVLWAWLDLLWELRPAVRLAAWGVAAGAAAVVIGYGIFRSRRRATDTALADAIDRSAGTGGQVLTGLELSAAAALPGKLSRGLASLAVEQAAHAARAIAAETVVAARPALRALATCLTVLAAIALVFLVLPDLAHTQWLRLSDPLGDHPPFSRVKLSVEPGDTQVIYGDGLEIRAAASGAPVERVELVVQMAGTSEPDVLPMFPEADGHWRASLAELVAPSTYHVRGGGARSARHTIGIVTIPRIEKVEFRVTPPAYTQQSATEGPLPADGLSGLPGTEVQVRATSNRPLAGGTIHIDGPQAETIALAPVRPADQPDGSRQVAGKFAIRSSARFALSVCDVQGQASRERFAGAITLLADQRPFIRITEPPSVSLATPTATIPVTLSAEDDYGIASVQLFRSLNDSRPLPMSPRLAAAVSRRLSTTVELPLAAYGLEPGDVIKLFARVEDNDPAGGKGSESPVVVLNIVSQQDFDRMLRARYNLEMLMSKYEQAERRLDAARQEHEGLRKKLKERGDKPASDADRKALEKLAQRLKLDAAELRKAAAEALPYDIDRKLTQRLTRMAKAMDEASRGLERLSQRQNLSASELDRELEAAMKSLEGEGLDFEQQALDPLEHLNRIFPLIADQSRFVEIYQRQRELAERAAALKGHDGADDPATKARMRDLESEQLELNQDLDELVEDIESHVAVLPEDANLDELRESARKFVDALRASKARDTMDQAANALAEFAGTRAAERTKTAADLLEKLLGRCQGMSKSGQSALIFKPSLSNCLGNTVAQLLADMGLNSGDSPGEGSGRGGYSTRRNSLSNVGLYGAATHAGQALGGRGNRRRTSAIGDDAESGAIGAASPGATAGQAGGAAVELLPTQYRRRVGEYFRRIAEELEQP